MGKLARHTTRVCLMTVLVVVALGASAIAAYAGSSWGPWCNIGTVDGVYYQARNAVTDFDDGSGVTARKQVQSTNVIIPAAHAWVMAELYNGSGGWMASSDGVANPYAMWDFAGEPTDKKDNHGYYYGLGGAQFKRADGEWTLAYTVTKSPTIHHTD